MLDGILDELDEDTFDTQMAETGEILAPTVDIAELIDQEVSLPLAFLQANAGKMRSTDAIVDFATTVCMAVSQGELKVSQSAELRKWAELMYTCLAVGRNGSNTQVNYIGQLVQLAGVDPIEDREVIQVQEAILTKKAQGE